MKTLRMLNTMLLIVNIIACAGICVTYDYDEKVDFGQMKSFNWFPVPEPGTLEISELQFRRLKDAVYAELVSKGLQFSSDKPDFLIAFHVGTKDKIQVTDWGYGYGYRLWGGRSLYVDQYEEGTVILDFVLVTESPRTKRGRLPHDPHPLARDPKREPSPIRVLGLSTTAMSAAHPRYSTSEDLLQHALRAARERSDSACDTQLIRVRDLSFRACEGFYSNSARACTWPCSITQMDSKDQMDRVYEGVVHWADVIVIATPIRWGSASSLYFKMIERMNCIQNQETVANRHLLRNKVVALIITGGQDNVQAVAGQMLTFFAELGCQFPHFPITYAARQARDSLLVRQGCCLGATVLPLHCHYTAPMGNAPHGSSIMTVQWQCNGTQVAPWEERLGVGRGLKGPSLFSVA